MKKVGIFILSILSISIIGNYTHANNEYEYTNLDITANVLIDGTIDIKEDFTANFFVSKHGIIRDIPLNYSVGGNDFHIEISNINVQGKTYSTSNNNGNIEIKIGDADRTVIGEQNYPISYSSYGLIRNFSGMGYAELYWNLVGYEFDTNINKVRAEIILPEPYTGFTKDDFLITTDGMSKTIDGFDGTIDWSNGDRIIITYDKGLSAYHGITLAIKFPNDYFRFDDGGQSRLVGNVWNKVDTIEYSGNKTKTLDLGNIFGRISFFIIFIIIAGCFTSSKLFENIREKYGTNLGSGILKGIFNRGQSIVIQYNPPKGLNSAEVGLLLHRQAYTKDMLSLIYKRALEGLINISVNKDEDGASTSLTSKQIINIKRNNNIPENYPDYEYKLFNQLIPGKTNEIDPLKGLYFKLDKSSLEEYGKDKGWLTTNTNNNIKAVFFFILGILFVFLSIWKFKFLFLFGSCFIIVPFIIIASRGKFKETEEGAKLISGILGYKEFLKACDEDKLRLFLQQDPLYFDKTLPYAIVFGLETELIKKITPIMEEMNIKSSRYEGDLTNITDTVATISTFISYSEPSYSSSGGFDSGSSFDSGGSDFDSGGGGGGGGGSSW